jgi:phytoene dehydrogenase-like protein
MSRATNRFDVAIVGGGHNGLTAAAYLALAGKKVVVLEKLGVVGGAAVSAEAFAGVDARLSRYSYLVSLLPARIIADLGLDLRFVHRRYSSYTPRGSSGMLVDDADPAARALGADAEAWIRFYDGTRKMAERIFPTVTEPLLTRSEARAAVADDALWNDLIEHPIGSAIEREFTDDIVRGVVLTDGLIGTFAPNIDETLTANRCFLYHVIGNGTGDWNVPVGGMGAVTGELHRVARGAGATIMTGAEVTAITPDGEVFYGDGSSIGADLVLANVAPFVLERLVAAGTTDAAAPAAGPAGTAPRLPASPTRATPSPAAARLAKPEGAQVKVNLLISRLPKLIDESVDPEAAFGGTFHVNESWSQLSAAFDEAASGNIPSPLPLEIYCHSLSDPSILAPELRESGAQTITVFGLHVPDRLITPENNESMRADLQAAALESLDSVLAEPIESLLLTDAAGSPTIETKTTLDIELALGMPGGNIFHGPLSWPFLEDSASVSTAAERWGVATRWPRILMCGSGAQRGGAVSGIGGHNAAMAVLEGA